MITLKSIKENGGATLSKAGLTMNFPSGYQVSIKDLLIVPIYKLRMRDIKSMLNDLDRGDCLGIWIDGGKAYVDKSQWLIRKRDAMRIGKRNKQISIWSWKEKKAVYL